MPSSPIPPGVETRERYVLVSENGHVGETFYRSHEEAEKVRRSSASGGFYHVRPVRLSVEVLGSPPEPWCFRVIGDRVVPL